jgi:hypothetical protein
MAATQRSNPCSAALFSFVTTFALLYMVNSLWSSSHSQMFATAAVHRMQPVAQPQGLSHMPLLVPGPDLYGNVARGHGPIHSSAAAQVVGYHSAQLSDETDHARAPSKARPTTVGIVALTGTVAAIVVAVWHALHYRRHFHSQSAGSEQAQWALLSVTGTKKAPLKLTAEQVIRQMYENINVRNVEGAMEYIDDECVYQDLNFPEPYEGGEAVRKLFTESCSGIPDDLLFCIDEITTGDPLACGVTWHVELDGIPFPNGRGCSYYRISPDTGRLIYARDLVESALKPGEAAFSILRLLSPVVRVVLKGQRRDGASQSTGDLKVSVSQSTDIEGAGELQGGPIFGAIFGLAAAVYVYLLFISPSGGLMPGDPAWAIKPEDLQEVIGESINFFFILPILNMLGISGNGILEAPIVNPVAESVFNINEAYIFMFLPLLLMDRRGRENLPTVTMWGLGMFLTNSMVLSYLAVRAITPTAGPPDSKSPLARPFGITGAVVFMVAIIWFFVGRPDVGGDLTERVAFFQQIITHQRASFSYLLDSALFYMAQIILIGAVDSEESSKRWLRFVPFWGLAAWLII